MSFTSTSLSFSYELLFQRLESSHRKYYISTIRSFSIGHGYFYVLILFGSLTYVSIAMFLVYLAVHGVEKDAAKYSFARYSVKEKYTMKMSRRVMLQGILYSAILILLCICFVLIVFIQALDSSYAVEIMNSIFFPSQGFFNALIYMIPLFKQIMKKRRNKKKAQQNVQSSIQNQQHTPSSIQNHQNISSSTSWLARLKLVCSSQTSSINKITKSNIRQQLDAESKCREGEILVDNNSRDDVFKLTFCPNDKLEENSDHKKNLSITPKIDVKECNKEELLDGSYTVGISKQKSGPGDEILLEETNDEEDQMSISQHNTGVERGCMDEEILNGNSKGDVSKQIFSPNDELFENNYEEEQIPYLNSLSKSEDEKLVMVEEIKGEGSSIVATSNLMLAHGDEEKEEEEEEALKSKSFALPQRFRSSAAFPRHFGLNRELKSSSSFFSRKSGLKKQYKSSGTRSLRFEKDYKPSSFALPRGNFEFEGVDEVVNKGNDSDDESYVDDYLKMMED